jgi:predicted nucleotidyltransferase
MNLQGIQLRHHQKSFLDRFVKACLADDRVVAAFLGGSNVKGYADAYSDIDLCVITTDQAFEEFFKEREAFLRSLGDLVFLEDFDSPDIAFYIFSDDTDGELYFGRESRLDQIHSGPFRALLDKKNILADAVFPPFEPSPFDQVEKLRRQIYGFWHELSHFITAMSRGQLWWAHGQLEALRWVGVNLARLRNNFSDAGAGEEAYFKIENEIPVEQLETLQGTFCPLQEDAMLKAVFMIVSFYLELAPPLAQMHGLRYSHDLERVMIDRLQKLNDARLHRDVA